LLRKQEAVQSVVGTVSGLINTYFPGPLARRRRCQHNGNNPQMQMQFTQRSRNNARFGLDNRRKDGLIGKPEASKHQDLLLPLAS
jgi:hypothetical protein